MMAKKFAIGLILAGPVLAMVIGYLFLSAEHDHGQSVQPLEELSAVPYLAHVDEEQHGEKVGVISHDEKLAHRGFTVFGSRDKKKEAYLLDMEGNILHEWNPAVDSGQSLLWLLPHDDGHFIALGRDYLIKMDWRANVLWTADPLAYHHGFALDERGSIYSLTTRKRKINYADKRIPISDQYITILSPDGRTQKELSLYDLVGKRISSTQLELIEYAIEKADLDPGLLEETLAVDDPYDVFHINSVSVIDRDIGIAKKGDLLACLRSMNLILIIDPEREEIVWEWAEGQETLDRPHRPVLLSNGNILIFDNGWRRGYSRIVELNPYSEEIVWRYTGTPKESFFTRRGGLAQKLSNGNVLITESDKGHVFEITTDGQIVWDFWNVKFGENGKRRTIYRAWRLLDGELKVLKFDPELRRELMAKGYFNSTADGVTR